MPDVLDAPAKRYPFSNVDKARQAGLRSVEARRLKAELAAQQLIERNAAAQEPVPTVQPVDDFATRRLIRVREQLNRLDDLASKETDSKVLKEYADATTRLSEQERVLAGRPLPGSRRPVADRVDRRAPAGQLAPLSVAAPVAVPVPSPPEQVAPGPARALGWEYDEPTTIEKLPGDVTP